MSIHGIQLIRQEDGIFFDVMEKMTGRMYEIQMNHILCKWLALSTYRQYKYLFFNLPACTGETSQQHVQMSTCSYKILRFDIFVKHIRYTGK